MTSGGWCIIIIGRLEAIKRIFAQRHGEQKKEFMTESFNDKIIERGGIKCKESNKIIKSWWLVSCFVTYLKQNSCECS